MHTITGHYHYKACELLYLKYKHKLTKIIMKQFHFTISNRCYPQLFHVFRKPAGLDGSSSKQYLSQAGCCSQCL